MFYIFERRVFVMRFSLKGVDACLVRLFSLR